MNKIIINKKESKVYFFASFGTFVILSFTGFYTWFPLLMESESILLLTFRILNILSIGSVTFINVLIYFPLAINFSKENKNTNTILALRGLTLCLSVIFSIFSLIFIAQPFLHLFCVTLLFILFYFYDIYVVSISQKENSEESKNIEMTMRNSITEFTRPMVRTYTIFFLIVTVIFLISQKTNPKQSILIIETFCSGMVSFNLFLTTLVFVEQNLKSWSENENNCEL